ncbi:hypothetical protein [Paraburkholderia tropica]|uniref:hypothetical protein n=1 Tax=Paraburkholderia tropica TaxID=92647 RepID=UPI001CC6E31B|nr:hypothetical protein [Paraburkholderia tropica]
MRDTVITLARGIGITAIETLRSDGDRVVIGLQPACFDGVSGKNENYAHGLAQV